MKVLVIGATGWIGSAVIEQLLLSQHQVTAFVRSEIARQPLEVKGINVVLGDLTNNSLLGSIARQTDAVIFASSASLNATLAGLETIRTALQQTYKPLIYISGSSLYGNIAKEREVSEAVFIERLNTPEMNQSPENLVCSAIKYGVKGIVIVGAGLLYGRGGGATPTFLLKDARAREIAFYIGEGNQRWSAIHVDDLARLVIRAMEQKPLESIFNAVAGSLPLKEVAEIIADSTKVKGWTESISEETAAREWNSFWATTLSGNLWLSSFQATSILGWQPNSPSFKDDVLHGSYKS